MTDWLIAHEDCILPWFMQSMQASTWFKYVLHLQSLALSKTMRVYESDLQCSIVLPLWGYYIYLDESLPDGKGKRPKVLALLLRYHYWTSSVRLIQLALQYRYIYSTSNVPSFLSTTKTPNTKSSKKPRHQTAKALDESVSWASLFTFYFALLFILLFDLLFCLFCHLISCYFILLFMVPIPEFSLHLFIEIQNLLPGLRTRKVV